MYQFVYIGGLNSNRMLSKSKGIVLAIAAIMAFTTAMPIAGASNIHTVLSPSTGSANVTAYVNTTATVKTSSTLLVNLLGGIHNSSDHDVVKSSSAIYTDFQGALSANSSTATLSYLDMNAQTNFTRVSSHEITINHTLKIVMNVTGLSHNGTIDMSWRGFSDSKQIVINNTEYNYFNVDGQNTSQSGRFYNSVNFTAFSEPLTNWTRHYDAATNMTTFSKDAGYTLNYVANLSVNSSYLNVTVKSDPSYTIATPGYAQAGANSLTISSPPSSSLMYVYYGVLVLIIAVGFGVTLSLRRRNRRR